MRALNIYKNILEDSTKCLHSKGVFEMIRVFFGYLLLTPLIVRCSMFRAFNMIPALACIHCCTSSPWEGNAGPAVTAPSLPNQHGAFQDAMAKRDHFLILSPNKVRAATANLNCVYLFRHGNIVLCSVLVPTSPRG